MNYDDMLFVESDTAVELLDAMRPTGDAIQQLIRSMNRISMLVRCPRSVVLNASRELDHTSIENMARGTSMHEAFQRNQLVVEYNLKYDGITGHVDIIREYPIELYTTQSSKDFKPNRYPLKVSQLMSYIYMLHKTGQIKELVGEVGVFHILKMTVNVITGESMRRLLTFELSFTIGQLEENWRNIKYNQALIKRYLVEQKLPDMNPTITPEFNECTYCPHYEYCYGELISEEDKNKMGVE